MTRLEFLKAQMLWAESWLAKPASELPGKLTHEICLAVLHDSMVEMVNYTVICDGMATYNEKP